MPAKRVAPKPAAGPAKKGAGSESKTLSLRDVEQRFNWTPQSSRDKFDRSFGKSIVSNLMDDLVGRLKSSGD